MLRSVEKQNASAEAPISKFNKTLLFKLFWDKDFI